MYPKTVTHRMPLQRNIAIFVTSVWAIEARTSSRDTNTSNKEFGRDTRYYLAIVRVKPPTKFQGLSPGL